MDVNDLFAATVWIERHLRGKDWESLENLQRLLDQNSQGNEKQPLKEALAAVHIFFNTMPTEQLNIQQQTLFNSNRVLGFIGFAGWSEVERIVKTREQYDPASAAQDFRAFKDRLSTFAESMINFQISLINTGFNENTLPEVDIDKVRIDVYFRGDASIDDITELRDWSDEWYHIMQNLAAANGEAPESVKVVGASTGSIIIFIMGTLSVETLIALILKQIANGVDQVFVIRNTAEDFRIKKVLNKQLEKALKDREKEIAITAQKSAVEAILKKIGPQNGEAQTKVSKAVEKFFSFTALGGLVDLSTPNKEDLTDEQQQEAAEINDATTAMRQLSTEMRRMLTFKPDVENLNGDQI
jgi:hypothetical protein